jgi:hypothetical protein
MDDRTKNGQVVGPPQLPRDLLREPPLSSGEVFGSVEGVKQKLKTDNISRFVNKFRGKIISLEHIQADLTKYDVEVCHGELAQVVVESVLTSQETTEATQAI